MNMFILDSDPRKIAEYHCDKHVVKMITETFQMCGSALIRHGEKRLPKTKCGHTLLGGYPNHPVTRWIGDNRKNFVFASNVGIELCFEYTFRYKKEHFCEYGLKHMLTLAESIPDTHNEMTPFAQAMPEKYKSKCAIFAYRNYYAYEKRVVMNKFSWEKGRPEPTWINELISNSPVFIEKDKNAIQN